MVPPDAVPIAGSPPATLYDFLAAGAFPNTVYRLSTDEIIVDVADLVSGRGKGLMEKALEEIGEPLRKNFWVIDPLPRARVWASKAFGYEFDEDGKTQWKV